MLLELNIKDFAIIDNLHLSLHRLFNVFTGETGAGKSIIIDAVSALLGGKIGASRGHNNDLTKGTDSSAGFLGTGYKYDAWGTIVRPTDLTTGIYRGGRRPIDLYWRIHSGINGVSMPASEKLEPKDIWDLVNFLQVLPYPAMREKYKINLESNIPTQVAARP